jgi:hypothetical protein
MIIQTVPTPHFVDDYDIVLVSGVNLPFTIDPDAGDTIEFTKVPLAVQIHITEKAHAMDPDKKIPAKNITIYERHIASVVHSRREVAPPTPEQQFALKNLIQKLHPTVQ